MRFEIHYQIIAGTTGRIIHQGSREVEAPTTEIAETKVTDWVTDNSAYYDPRVDPIVEIRNTAELLST